LTDTEKPSQENQDPEQALEKPKMELAAEEVDSKRVQGETELELALENTRESSEPELKLEKLKPDSVSGMLAAEPASPKLVSQPLQKEQEPDPMAFPEKSDPNSSKEPELNLKNVAENLDPNPESPRNRNTNCDSSNCYPASAAVAVQLEEAATGNGNGVKEEEVPAQVLEKRSTKKSDRSSKKKSDESSETVSEKSSNKTSETASNESSKDVRTSVIDVRNLVRPFTEKKLFDLFKRTGKIVDNGFWIDKIKSHAIVKVKAALFLFLKKNLLIKIL